MIELAKHIEKLLLDNDCVIVPGLGGFVAHYTPSVRMEDENLFLPPARAIGFNPQVKMNDGLLVQSYMEVYGTSFSDATRLVNKQVEDLRHHLHEDGKADLPNVGELRCSIRDTYEFAPYNDKIATPYLYGLAGFEMKTLKSIRTAPHKKSVPDYLKQDKHLGRRIKLEINFKPSYWLNAAAMIALIMLFFLLSTPIENTEVVKGNYASLFPHDMFKAMGTQSLAFTPLAPSIATPSAKESRAHNIQVPQKKSREMATPIVVREVKVDSPTPTPKAAQHQSESAKPAPAVAKRYHIIVASVGTENDASQMVRNLVEKGFKGASTVIGDGKNRVSIESCATHAEAQQTLNEVRKNEAYKSAWVLKH